MKKEEPGMFHFIMRTGQEPKKRKVKRGFRTKKEALNFEAEYKEQRKQTWI